MSLALGLGILYWFLVAAMLVGVVGAFVPGIPGTSVILSAIVIWGLVLQNATPIGWGIILWPAVTALLVLLFSFGVDFLAGYFGAQKAGASKWGQIGAIVGMVLCFLGLLPALPFGGPLLGLLVGPFIGAIVGEYLYCKDWAKSFKAGVGIVVGSVVGSLIQGMVAIVPVVIFLFYTLPNLPQ
jgi:uncharacterized protein